MTLTLLIRNAASLDNGMPVEFVLHRRGAIIGRAPTCDWSLPDPRNHISSRHCEITFSDNAYLLTDISTNGTFLKGAGDRLAGPHRIAHGDVFEIGHYELAASLSGHASDDGAAGSSPPETAGTTGWYKRGQAGDPSGWGPDDRGGVLESGGFGWGAPPAPPAPVQSNEGWAPSHRMPDIPAAASPWDSARPSVTPASNWSSAAPDRPPPPSADDVWGRIAEGNVVDWARGGFGQPQTPARDPLGLDPPASADWLPAQRPPVPEEAPAPRAAPPSAPAGRVDPAPAASADEMFAFLLQAAGLQRADVTGDGRTGLARSGLLLQRLVAGLVVMVEARARAKSQMGAEATNLQLDGNNPIKFARSPDQALARLLGEAERGFMEPERAVEDAFFDLQSHQMATLKAMQGALKATLDRFSPIAVRQRAGPGGFLARLLPMARRSLLWKAYERDFSGVARDSDEAFMDVFAREFRKAYEEQTRAQRRP